MSADIRAFFPYFSYIVGGLLASKISGDSLPLHAPMSLQSLKSGVIFAFSPDRFVKYLTSMFVSMSFVCAANFPAKILPLDIFPSLLL